MQVRTLLHHPKYFPDQQLNMFPTYEGENTKKELVTYLKNSNLSYTFNSNPERFISRSITPTNLQSFLTCPHCHFQKRKLGTQSETEQMKISKAIHFILDYIYRNNLRFQKSLQVLDYINFRDGNLLEDLKTDEENLNYDILRFLAEIEDEEIKEQIIRGVIIGFGTAKKLGFQEVRKKDSISLNLTHNKNKGQITLFNKPDLTGRHPTIYTKTLRKYDNFLIDYKLNFDPSKDTNSLQTAIYYLTHLLSNRDIHHYYILDLSNANFFRLRETNIQTIIDMLNKFLMLKNINYRRKNNSHIHFENPETPENLQADFLSQVEIESFSASDFGSKIYEQIKRLQEELETKTVWEQIESPVTSDEIEKIMIEYHRRYDL